MGTSASTQQDVSPITSSTMPSHSISSLMGNQRNNAFPPLHSMGLPDNLENHNTALLQQAIMAPADGYKWRKYGQKSVKGSEHPRNYYKCTFPGCGVKKYVEKQEEDGKVVDKVTYKGGEHTHDPSRITRLNAVDQTSFKQSVLSESLGAETRTHETLEISDPSSPNGTATITAEGSATIFPASPRLVVETTADVDHNDDGYSWRKYGQKNVKGSVGYAPRSYYRCTQEDCPVKKQVEQRGNSIFNTYEGTHNHLAPGWEEVNKKKKRKLSRTSLERSLLPRVMEARLEKNMENNEMSDKVGDENDMTNSKNYVGTPEEAIALVISEANHANEARTLIPLQELQSEPSSLQSLP